MLNICSLQILNIYSHLFSFRQVKCVKFHTNLGISEIYAEYLQPSDTEHSSLRCVKFHTNSGINFPMIINVINEILNLRIVRNFLHF